MQYSRSNVYRHPAQQMPLASRHHRPAIIIIGSTPTRTRRLPASHNRRHYIAHTLHAVRIAPSSLFTFLAATPPRILSLPRSSKRRRRRRLSIGPQFGLVQYTVHAALRVWVPQPLPTLARDVTERCVCMLRRFVLPY